MDFHYIKENGEKIKTEIERWAWGVVYKPTADQIKSAEAETTLRCEELTTLRNTTLKSMRESGAPKVAMDRLAEEFKFKMSQVIQPTQDELKQYTADGVFHRFSEIDQERVDIFTMFRVDDETMIKRIDIEVSPDMQLFHFYRNIGLDYQSKENFRKIRIMLFGWKSKDGGMCYNYILPDDRLITSNKDIVDLLRYEI